MHVTCRVPLPRGNFKTTDAISSAKTHLWLQLHIGEYKFRTTVHGITIRATVVPSPSGSQADPGKVNTGFSSIPPSTSGVVVVGVVTLSEMGFSGFVVVGRVFGFFLMGHFGVGLLLFSRSNESG
jgi:hypothetical protein